MCTTLIFSGVGRKRLFALARHGIDPLLSGKGRIQCYHVWFHTHPSTKSVILTIHISTMHMSPLISDTHLMMTHGSNRMHELLIHKLLLIPCSIINAYHAYQIQKSQECVMICSIFVFCHSCLATQLCLYDRCPVNKSYTCFV